MRLAIAVAILSACSTAAIAAPAKKPTAAKAEKPSIYYDFKSARLGMTLAEVKALPAPTNPPYQSSFTQYGPEQFYCSTDTLSDGKQVSFYPSKVEQALGVIQCKYGREYKIGRNYTTVQDSSISIGSYQTDDVTYKFMDGRLYQISIRGHANLLTEVLDGLNAKFGEPDSVVNDTTQNKAGATFPHTRQIWVNPAATITVEAPWTRIDNLYVSFSTTEGTSRVVAAEKALNPSAQKM